MTTTVSACKCSHHSRISCKTMGTPCCENCPELKDPTHSPTETVSEGKPIDYNKMELARFADDWESKKEPTVDKWVYHLRWIIDNASSEDMEGELSDLIRQSVQEAKAEERERILEAIQPAVNDFMAAANTLVKHKMVKTAKEMRENTQYIVCAIRGTHKEYAASLKQEEE